MVTPMPCRLIFIGLTCALVAGCDNKAETHLTPQPVDAIRASLASYASTAAVTGEIKATTQTELSFRAGGQVVQWNADVGSHVHAGDVLARIDDTEQRADVQSAQAGVDSAQAIVRQKALAFKRYEALLKTRAIPRATFDQAQEDLASARANLDAAETALETAKDALSYTLLKADTDGIVTARKIEVGQVVAVAQAAFALARDGNRDAVFNMFKAFFLEGEPQTDVKVALVDDPSKQTQARIREISPTIDIAAGTVRVKVALPEQARWPLGTSIIGEFHARARTGIALPASAMTSADGEPAVWVIDPATKAVSLRGVTVSQYRTGDFLVASGISPGELVVTEGGKFLREKQLVDWEGK